MEAGTLNCPMCGAPSASDATHCEHCGARLATVACPSCFGLMFVGEKFCPHCGAAAQRITVDARSNLPCQRCETFLETAEVGGHTIRECARCDGLWIDNETFQTICAEREQQVPFLGIPSLQNPNAVATLGPVAYLKCPACRELMNRVNFAACSGVIIDVCRADGTWFDHAELRRIIDFIREGGMDKARDRELRHLADERARLAAARANAGSAEPIVAPTRWDGFGRTMPEIDVIADLGGIVWDLLGRK